MTVNTISALVPPGVMALAEGPGRALMQTPLTAEMMADVSASITIERGERFVVQRGLAIAPIRGLLTPNMAVFERWLGWSTFFGIEETMAELAADDDVRAIAVPVDSPGGMVRGCEAAAEAIAAAAAVKPVHVLASPLCASAAYWLASQATTITMTPGSDVGSIGVAMSIGAPVAPNGAGDQWFDFLSSHARAKRPDPTTETGQAECARQLDEIEALFHAAVAAGRGIPEADLLSRLSVTDDAQDGGAVFNPQQAVARGLVDGVETRAAFFERMAAFAAPPVQSSSAAAYIRRARAEAQIALSQF